MEKVTPNDITVILLSLGVLLGVARALGELAQRLHQPAVLGELLAGVLLGPTVLGRVAPAASAYLFPSSGPPAIALDAIATLAIVLFLMVAGIEVDLSTVWRQGRTGAKVGIASVVVPVAGGLAAASLAPAALGRQPGADPLIFALSLAIAIAISALPVIARTLMDLGLYRTDLGMVVVGAAILNDLVGWILFAVVLGLLGGAGATADGLIVTVALTLTFAAAVLTVGRWLIHRALPFVQAYTQWPAGELGFAVVLALLGAACTQWIGIHAIFGAFLVGAALGDSSHLRERTRATIGQFVSTIFAPLFFASVGLRVDFLAHFEPVLVGTVLAVAFVCKLAGGVLGARWGGLTRREAWGVGFSMVSVGAMGVIIGLLALEAGIIHERLFVALVVMAMLTSMASGPALRLILRPVEAWSLREVLSSRSFVRSLRSSSAREAIAELADAACRVADLDSKAVTAVVWEREQVFSTGIGSGVAIPHGRIAGLREPVVAVGISSAGIDFDAPDDRPAQVVFLLLTPADDPGAQLEIAAAIARLFRNQEMTEGVLRTRSFTEFLALVSADSLSRSV